MLLFLSDIGDAVKSISAHGCQQAVTFAA